MNQAIKVLVSSNNNNSPFSELSSTIVHRIAAYNNEQYAFSRVSIYLTVHFPN